MAIIETKLFGVSIGRVEVRSPIVIEVPTAYKMNKGEKLCLQNNGDGFYWVQVKEGSCVRVLDNPVLSGVRLGSKVPFVSRRLVLE